MLSPEEQAGAAQATAKVRQAALNALEANPGGSFAIHFVANLQRGVDEVLQSAVAQGLKIDCKAGCSHCCSVRVEALDPEVFRIAQALRQRPPEAREALVARLHKHAATVGGVPVAQHRVSCPFLERDLCSIYEVRPAVCRKVHSFDVEKCRTPGAEIPQSLDVLLKSEVLVDGTANAYARRHMQASGHELGHAVLLALTDPTAEARWAGGEAVFGAVGKARRQG